MCKGKTYFEGNALFDGDTSDGGDNFTDKGVVSDQ
jgi:hypothetical protein